MEKVGGIHVHAQPIVLHKLKLSWQWFCSFCEGKQSFWETISKSQASSQSCPSYSTLTDLGSFKYERSSHVPSLSPLHLPKSHLAFKIQDSHFSIKPLLSPLTEGTSKKSFNNYFFKINFLVNHALSCHISYTATLN